ncbi:hypothetical protein BCR33DRAFT_11987 [Rhizoclosmatium globosum]|uniref:Thioesterase domain-containing protein n=1 Tax=Rhizoclosmatium globosum TaxID=329046 RepID=A0A1Y2CPC5_9FUNG|nr:hypothetical protein BCR33DRAFT_11987 [Rhizoclosmatium globosum]|eukprot:ORY48843.1 hypothetical protein BCR33DRAFT_11987 [Rhizoclosmatium globosum]
MNETEKQKVERLNESFKLFTQQPTHTSQLSQMKVIHLSEAESTVTFELTLDSKHMLNYRGGLHGGLIATIIDDCTSWTFIGINNRTEHVSIDLSVSYVSAAKEGDTIWIVCKSKSVGRTLLFAEASLHLKTADGKRGKLLAFGKHTKFSVEARL